MKSFTHQNKPKVLIFYCIRIFFVLLFIAFLSNAFATQLKIKKMVVCSLTNCPLPTIDLQPDDFNHTQAIIYQTSPYGLMEKKIIFFEDTKHSRHFQIDIDPSHYVTTAPIVGFGGSFTDSAALLYASLPLQLKKIVIAAYYSYSGNAYTLGRVPIASTDFSCRTDENKPPFSGAPSLNHCSNKTSTYTYDDVLDKDLNYFSLADEDVNFKIPFIKDALAKVHQNNFDMRLFASPWSAPAWMKTNGHMVGGSLKSEYQVTWANYFIKFLQNYDHNGIHFWAVTVQNEPTDSVILGKTFQSWQTMFFTLDEEASFVRDSLAPALENYQKETGKKINIIVHDDQINNILLKINKMAEAKALNRIAGAGLHWYRNFFWSNLSNLDKSFIQLNSGKENDDYRFILGTEACAGYTPWEKGPRLGEWSRGEAYAHDILNDLKHHVSGWTDWNLLLDMHGGPNWAGNYVDAPILVDTQKQTLYFQPMYFYLAHFSRFLRPGSHQIVSQSRGIIPLEEVSYKVPAYDDLPAMVVVIVLNRDYSTRHYALYQENKSQQPYLNLSIPARTIQTILFPVS